MQGFPFVNSSVPNEEVEGAHCKFYCANEEVEHARSNILGFILFCFLVFLLFVIFIYLRFAIFICYFKFVYMCNLFKKNIMYNFCCYSD